MSPESNLHVSYPNGIWEILNYVSEKDNCEYIMDFDFYGFIPCHCGSLLGPRVMKFSIFC